MATTPAGLAAKCRRMTMVIPQAQRQAAETSARAIKPVWFAEAGLSASSRIAGGKVGIRDTTTGIGNVTTLLRWAGAVHLVEGNTAAHLIAARRLGTRSANRGRTNRLSVGAGLNQAFGSTGANRGVFGSLRSATVNGRRGQRAFNGKRALTIGGPGGKLRPYAFHKGTTGRGFWARNKASARGISTAVYRASIGPSILRKAGFG